MSETAESPAGRLVNLPEYSVTELSAALKRTVEEDFPFVRVRGEVSGLKAAASGHIYFDLKDDKAVLNAIIWKPTARLLKVRPEPGLEVICTGRVTTYPGLVPLSADRGAGGTGRPRRADGDAGGAQEAAWPPKACSMPRARSRFRSCRR